MSNKRVSELIELPAANLKPEDLFLVVDTAGQESKKIKAKSIKEYATGFGSLTGSITHAKLADTASYINPNNIGIIAFASYSLSSSYAISSSWSDFSGTASYVDLANVHGTLTSAETASYVLHVSGVYSGKISEAEHADTSSWSIFSKTASYLFYVPGKNNGRVTNADTASYSNFAVSASWAPGGDGTGVASASLWASTSLFSSYSFVSDFAIVAGQALNAESAAYTAMTDTASYAVSTERSDFANAANFSYFSETASYAGTSSVCKESISASYSLATRFIEGMSNGTASYAKTASIVTDPNVQRIWGPYNTKNGPQGNVQHVYNEAYVSGFLIRQKDDDHTRILVTAFLDILVQTTFSSSIIGVPEINLYVDYFSAYGTSETNTKLDTHYALSILDVQGVPSASFVGHSMQSITLNNDYDAISTDPYDPQSYYRFRITIEKMQTARIVLERPVKFFIYTPTDTTVEWVNIPHPTP